MKYTPLILATAASAITLAAAMPAFADTNCQSIYGGGQTCGSGNLTIEKQVMNPSTNQYVDNLSTQDPSYQPGAFIHFRILVTNTSNTTLTNVVVKDTINPTQEFVTFKSTNLTTSFDASNTVVYTIASMPAGQQAELDITAEVVPAANLPVNTNQVCPTNFASVSADNNAPAQASSEFCIANPTATTTTVPVVQVFPPTTTKSSPGTGPESLPLLAMIPTAGVGFWLRKKSK